ncbi:MAG: DsrE family protein [Thiobacillus sp.]|nr:MAG: hypothetical protein B7Y27_08350 [Hydrogenophilales bacterium 16-64-40]OZA34595.1 MAG: hypothetical protein B7X82_04600 [Hydrogenophilales bacterium 17-64-65]HQT33602.1 DsrE family protein [Thiobacillus sp.]
MTRILTPFLAALFLATAPMAASAAEEKVVYHVNDSANARVAMNNVNNHLNAAPDAKIVVVTHGKGIDFLLNDAKDDKGEYAPVVSALKAKGVDFRVCNNTLKSRKLDASAVNMEATIVASGVAEIGKLQAQEGYVYLKP